VLTNAQAQRQVVERAGLAAINGDVLEFEE
jgi:hypothetical protein